MKFPLLWLLLVSLNTFSFAQILSEGFEGTFPPSGWSQDFVLNNNSWSAASGNSNGVVTNAHSGSSNAILVNFSTSPDVTKLISPPLNLSGVNAPELKFWYTLEEWASDQDELRVYYKTSFSGPWNLLASYTADVFSWTEISLSLPNQSANYFIAFEGTAQYGRGITIDDVLVDGSATCLQPSALSASTVSSTSSSLGWTELNGGSNWEIEWGTSGFTQGSGTVVPTSNNPYALSGLSANTDYDFYVRTLCGGGDNSNWSGPFSFSTPCTAVSAPWSENFDASGNIPNCWNQGPANSENWRFNNSSGHVGNAGNTGGSSSASGNRFAWVDDSNPNNTATTLLSPLIDVSGLTTPALSFYTISNNEGNSNVDFSVDVFDGSNWNNDFYFHNSNTYLGQWEYVLLNLSSLTISGTIQLRFVVDELVSGDYFDDRAIDDVRIDELPACPQPAMVSAAAFTETTAAVSWTENGTATSWELEYGPSGFTPGTGTLTTTSANPFTITGLTNMNSYDVCVRSVCGGNKSAWSCHSFDQPFVFSSSNLPIVVINTSGQTIQDNARIVSQMGIIHNAPLRNNLSDPFNNYNGNISIELRGSSSQSFPKKSYSIETQDILGGNNNVSLVDMPAENDWVLYAPYSDKTLIRNVFTYYFGNKIMPYAPRTKMCEVVLNGDYIGVYVLTEKIKQDQNRVDIADLTVNDVAGDSLSGGYIIKVDKTTGSSYDFYSNFLPPGALSGQTIGFQVHYPRPDTILQVQVDYIHDYLDSFELALNGPDYADSLLGFPYFADGLSFIDFFIMNELTKNVDAYRASTFLYKDKASNGGKLKMGPLWDFNISLGNANYCNGESVSGWGKDFNSICGTHGNLVPFWWDKLEQDPAYVTLRKCRWDYLRQNSLHTDTLISFIDNMALYLDEAQQRNFTRWPTLGNYVWPNDFIGNTYQEEINYFKTWLTNRMTWLDNNLPGAASDCSALLGEHQFNEENVSDIRIYPNPAGNALFIEARNLEKINIYNNLGQLMFSRKELPSNHYKVHQFNVSEWNSGLYLIEIIQTDNRLLRKVVVR